MVLLVVVGGGGSQIFSLSFGGLEHSFNLVEKKNKTP